MECLCSVASLIISFPLSLTEDYALLHHPLGSALWPWTRRIVLGVCGRGRVARLQRTRMMMREKIFQTQLHPFRPLTKGPFLEEPIGSTSFLLSVYKMCVGFLDTFCTLSEWWETEGKRRASLKSPGVGVALAPGLGSCCLAC